MQKHLEIVGLFLLLLCCLLCLIPSPSPLKGFDEEERKESTMNVKWCEPGFTQQGSGLAQSSVCMLFSERHVLLHSCVQLRSREATQPWGIGTGKGN